jgi:hypothetical protein
MRFFYILLSCILLTSAQVKAQSPPAPSQEPEIRHIKFYPNPATSIITFEFQKANTDTYSFQVFNFLGKKVYELANVNFRTVINLNDFSRGIYIFQLKDQNGQVVETGRFQVTK